MCCCDLENATNEDQRAVVLRHVKPTLALILRRVDPVKRRLKRVGIVEHKFFEKGLRGNSGDLLDGHALCQSIMIV